MTDYPNDIMGTLYTCYGKNNMKPKQWQGEIKAMRLGVNFVELEIDSRGSYFHILVGRHRYGNFICIPNWNIGTEIAEMTDRFWNLERITNYYPKLHKVDAISIVDGLVAVGSILNSKKQDI